MRTKTLLYFSIIILFSSLVHAQNFSNQRNFPTSPIFFHPATEYLFSVEIQEPALSEVTFTLNTTNYTFTSGEITNNSNRFKISFIGLSPGHRNYIWTVNTTSGVSAQTSNQLFLISQAPTENPLYITISPNQAASNDTVLINVDGYLSGQAPLTKENITNTTLFIYNFTSGTQNLVYNTSNFSYIKEGKWSALYNATSKGIGLYLATVIFTSNETTSQTWEKTSSFTVGVGYITNSTVGSSDSGGLLTSGILFLPNDTLIVDSLFTGTDGTNIAAAQCNLTLLDQNRSIVLARANMPETLTADISHYTYLNTNFTNITNTTTVGNFFGHVRCSGSGVTRISSVSFAILDIPNRVKNAINISNNTQVINELTTLNTTLISLINKNFDFSQEQIFLVTDSLNQVNTIAKLVSEGTLTPEEASQQLIAIKTTLLKALSHNTTQTIKPRATLSTFQETLISLKQKIFNWNAFLLGTLLATGIVLLITLKKKEDF